MIKIKDLKEELELSYKGAFNVSEFDDYTYEGYENYINEIISEIANSYVSVYYVDLIEWLKYNWEYVNEANKEFGVPEDGDIIKQVQQAQYFKNEQDLLEDLESMLLMAVYIQFQKEGIKELTEEQVKEIEEYIKEVDSGYKLSTIIEETLEIVKDIE